MVTILNEQSLPIDIKKLRLQAEQLLVATGYQDFDLGILLTSNDDMQEYNKTYRDKDKPTDILSFPYHDQARPGQQIIALTDEDKNLGDIILALAYIKEDAPRWNSSYEDRLTELLIHGFCHLRGYDHEDDADYEIMKKEEERLHGFFL